MSKELFFTEFRNSVNKMAEIYSLFMSSLGRYKITTPGAEEHFAGKGRVMELVSKARLDDRLLYGGDDDTIRYWWTHGECNLVALMLETLLQQKPELNARLVYVVDTEEEGYCRNYHALVRFELEGESYYADGLLFSKDYREIYRGDGLPPKEAEKDKWKQSLFYTDPCGMVLFSCWCEVFGLKTELVLKGWEQPTMLCGERDLEEYHKLLSARYVILNTLKPKTIAEAYEAGK